MPVITIDHPELGPQRTRLTADVTAAASTSTVANNTGFAQNDYVVFGELGQELTEIVLLTSVSASITLGHTVGPVFDHPSRTPVSEIRYNQAEIYRATSETGTYSLVTTVTLTPDEPATYYVDADGASTSWYKIRYKNATTAAVSDYSDVVQATGYSSNSLRALTDEVLEEFGDPDATQISRSHVRRLLRAGVRLLARQLVTVSPDYRRQYATQALTSGTATYDLPTRFLGFIRVDVNYTGSSATGAKKVEKFESEAEGYPDTTYLTDDPRVFIRGDQFGLRPTPTSSSGYAFLWYWDYPAEMTDEADEHGLPYGANEYLVTYALYRAWLTKDADRASGYKKELEDIWEDYITFISTSRQQYRNDRIGIEFGSDLYNQI